VARFSGATIRPIDGCLRSRPGNGIPYCPGREKHITAEYSGGWLANCKPETGQPTERPLPFLPDRR